MKTTTLVPTLIQNACVRRSLWKMDEEGKGDKIRDGWDEGDEEDEDEEVDIEELAIANLGVDKCASGRCRDMFVEWPETIDVDEADNNFEHEA
ncbi:hypothetical protein E6O75_ATG00397 [Venturia nashicola]|uniref:Uncharacterized protein n=1 Tax=Venturia nashicola TaxID=86259 RepID=A0A4Z1PW32_9PEZI|nr:hypothetical protein E6O75_ATG00397 [Venturia nashicola]